MFVSTHNLATNPRMVKEIELALSRGYETSVVCFEFNNWSRKQNNVIREKIKNRVHFYEIPASRRPFIPWFASTIVHILSGTFLNLFPGSIKMLSANSNKRSWLLMRKLNELKQGPMLVVAHNPGSFFPAMKFAQKINAGLGIDLEDYHPGETTDQKHAGRLTKLLNKVLPAADYITAASPLILEQSIAEIKNLKARPEVILNYSSRKEFNRPVSDEPGVLKLVWFSQNISFNRGLEQMITALNDSKQVELHLYGNPNQAFSEQWLSNRTNIHVHGPLPQELLHKELSNYHVGLALEPGKDMNNKLAISNKIIAYYQAGLFILASDTPAQIGFIELHPGHGLISSLNPEQLSKAIFKLIEIKNNIYKEAGHRYESAGVTSWETESMRLISTWDNLVG